jgi:hypothetical protein
MRWDGGRVGKDTFEGQLRDRGVDFDKFLSEGGDVGFPVAESAAVFGVVGWRELVGCV